MDTVVTAKIERLQAGARPRVLDLFSGCGGLFLGFHRAGCESIAGVEIDPLAALSYARNFHGHLSREAFDLHAAAKDITQIDAAELLSQLGYQSPASSVDVIVGGPPCPAFTRVGRAKLREIHQHPEAFRKDPRAQLYVPYLRFVETLKPVGLLLENVPDMLNYGGHNLGEEISESLEELGYRCAYTLLNCARYGVPQMRERFFLMAIRREVGREVDFPTPTHRVAFPPGYEGSRQVALKLLQGTQGTVGLFGERRSYKPAPSVPADAKPPVTAQEALGDLPPITAHLDGRDKRGARRFTSAVEYREDRTPSHYALAMRTWPGFEGTGRIYDHVTRCLSRRDYRLFRRMLPGDDYPRAHRLARILFEEALAELAKTGGGPVPGSPDYLRLQADYVPPYDPGKFPNKWRKMEPDQPARTLMAHLGKDGYSHIHYDSQQARVISVREAARLQSFPDGFVFEGTMNPAFRQIGNSVPPLMSYTLACSMLKQLGCATPARYGVDAGGRRSGERETRGMRS